MSQTHIDESGGGINIRISSKTARVLGLSFVLVLLALAVWAASVASDKKNKARLAAAFASTPTVPSSGVMSDGVEVRPENDPLVREGGRCAINFINSYDNSTNATISGTHWAKSTPYASSEYLNTCSSFQILDLLMCDVGGLGNPMQPMRLENITVNYAESRRTGGYVHIKVTSIESLSRRTHSVNFKYDFRQKRIVGHSPYDNGY